MKSTHRYSSAVAVVVVLILSAAAGAPSFADEDEVMESIAKAFEDGAKALRSGTGEGSLRDASEGRPETTLNFKFDFQGRNRFLQINYSPLTAKIWGESNLRQVRIVWDGTACVVTKFSSDFMPGHCETRVYKTFDSVLGSLPAMRGPIGDTSAWYPEQMVGKINADRYALEKLGKENWLLKRKPHDPAADGEELQLEANPKLGFNLSRYTSIRNLDGGQQIVTRQVSWTKRKDIWCVSRIAVDVKLPGMDKLFETFSLEYTQFQPDVEFPPGNFGLGRLGIVENSRILDERGAVLEDTRFHKDSGWEQAKSLSEAIDLLKD